MSEYKHAPFHPREVLELPPEECASGASVVELKIKRKELLEFISEYGTADSLPELDSGPGLRRPIEVVQGNPFRPSSAFDFCGPHVQFLDRFGCMESFARVVCSRLDGALLHEYRLRWLLAERRRLLNR